MNSLLDDYCPPPDDGLDVLHVDSALIVVNKPAGLLSVPGRGEGKADCLASRVMLRYPDALIVHRLDMATSGLLVLARGEMMQRELSRLFRERQIDKRYLALVRGQLAEARGEIDLPLICDWPNRPRQKVDFDIGKHSLTRFRLLDHDAASNTTRLELEPVTGRTHQLRVHLAALGHPIIGDPLYGGETGRAAARLHLHATDLALVHPSTATFLHFHRAAPF